MKNIWTKFRNFLSTGSKLSRFFKKLAIFLFVLIVLTIIAAQVTSRPQFCPTCHYMQTFYDSWKSSKHNNVTCVKCHFKPGLAGTVRGKFEGLVQVVMYVSQAYRKSKPWAEIPDESCLQSGCHETRLLQGDVMFKNVRFNHSVHLNELRRNKKLRCTSCHSQIVQGDHMVVTEGTCFLCHFKKSEYTDLNELTKISRCDNCHRWDLMTESDMAKFRYNHTEVVKKNIECVKCHNKVLNGSGNVPKENCFSCHYEQDRLSKYNDLNFVHKTHIAEHRVECIRCHLKIEHKIVKVSSDISPECNTCHQDLHSSQAILYTGHGGKSIEDYPSPMYKSGLNCAGCHYFHGMLNGKSSLSYAKGKACEECHGKGYDKILEKWKEISIKKTNELASIFNGVKSEVMNSSSQNKNESIKLVEDAEFNINLVKKGKGVHNIEYSDKLLQSGYLNLKQALKLISSSRKLPEMKLATDSIPSECVGCHIGITDIPVEIYGLKFSHRQHTIQNKMKCYDCHSNAGRHGQLIRKKEECTECHHRGEARLNCVKCHEMQTLVYNGAYNNLNQPSVMSLAEVKCIDCHIKEGDKITRPQKESCLKCHDASYQEKLTNWQTEIKKAIVELKNNISAVPRSKIDVKNEEVIKNANALIDNIIKDRSYGGHNYDIFKAELEKYKKIIIAIIK